MGMTPERWKEIEDLYHAAVDQAAEIQDSLLQKADPEVRALVRQLFSPQSSGLLDRPAWQSEETAATTLQVIGLGASLGPYRIEAKIGAGGMGEVFQASDTRLARKVAIKTIRAGRGSATLEAQFLKEARAASALNHPNIITIHDVGTMDGQLYIVMEWIEGQTLRQKLNQGLLPMDEVLRIATQILDALAAAHEGGFLHRDLKPENIMVTLTGRTKVLDFGLAKRIATASGATLDLVTGDPLGMVVGTPGYMSPEQARGETLDFRSDQFSFGTVLYELITGRRAFMGKSMAEVQAAVLLSEPQPLTSLRPQAPAPLQWLVERCLAKDSRNRFESTEALRRELATIVTRAASSSTVAKAMSNIPTPRTAFVGREGELSQLRALVADAGIRILTLTGPGGIGKTRLAVELARLMAGQFSAGVCFVRLENVRESSLVASEVALAIGIERGAGGDVEAAIADHMQRLPGPLLLVLDNLEHVLDSAVFVARLALDGVKVVVTSRAPLRIYGEHEFPVPGLKSGPDSPAVQLFLERATGLRAGTPDEEQLRIVAEICQRLDGLPLAIELAAARTRLFPLKTLQARLDDPLSLLVGGARDLPHRQHTLRATLDWSYNLLDAEHRKLFRRMAVFVGGATLEAIEAVCNTREDLKVNLWDAIELLADNNLIRRIDLYEAEPRFALFETMREYGLERLAEADEEPYTRKAHAAYFLVLAEEDAPVQRRERSGNHPFDADLGNFRSAMDWLVAAGEVEWGLRLVIALAVYFCALCIAAEGFDRISRLLAQPGVERFPRLQRNSYFWKCDFAFETGQYSPRRYQELWKMFEDAGDSQGMFRLANHLGVTLKFLDPEEARRWCERCVQMARESGNGAILGGALINLADIVKDTKIGYALALYAEGMRLFDQSGDEENAIWCLSHQADLFREQGDSGRALTLYTNALARFRRLNFQPGVASCLYDLAKMEASAGRSWEAQRLCRESLLLNGSDNPSNLPRVLESLAEFAIECDQPRRALTLGGASAAIRKRFKLWILNPARRAEVEAKIEAVRKDAGPEATALWMKGWNMSLEEIVAWATNEEES